MEEWRDIKGYEGLYQVSNEGRIKHNDYIKKPTPTTRGYLDVQLWKDGKCTHKLVHRVVFEAFVSDIPKGMQVNHIDECKTNNALSNLNLMSPMENINWGTGIEKQALAKSKKVYQYENGVLVGEFCSASEAARQLGYSQSEISVNCRGGRYKNGKWVVSKTYKGYKWSYEPL